MITFSAQQEHKLSWQQLSVVTAAAGAQGWVDAEEVAGPVYSASCNAAVWLQDSAFTFILGRKSRAGSSKSMLLDMYAARLAVLLLELGMLGLMVGCQSAWLGWYWFHKCSQKHAKKIPKINPTNQTLGLHILKTFNGETPLEMDS